MFKYKGVIVNSKLYYGVASLICKLMNEDILLPKMCFATPIKDVYSDTVKPDDRFIYVYFREEIEDSLQTGEFPNNVIIIDAESPTEGGISYSNIFYIISVILKKMEEN